MNEESPILRGSAIQSYDRATRRWSADRVCIADGCGTRLSVYNGLPYCWQHTPRRPWSGDRNHVLAS